MDFRLHSMVGQLRIERPFIFSVVFAWVHALELQWARDDNMHAILHHFVEGIPGLLASSSDACPGRITSSSNACPCYFRVASVQMVVCNSLSWDCNCDGFVKAFSVCFDVQVPAGLEDLDGRLLACLNRQL